MTPRENLLSLYRRTGYEYAPVSFNLCPAMREKARAAAGDIPLPEYFAYPEGFATQGTPGLKVKQRPAIDWRGFYDEPLLPGTNFDMWGVAHEPGSDAAAHMTRMKHPMKSLDSTEQIESYPWPEFDMDNTEHIRDGVAAAHANERAAIGGLACTVWEKSWYIRSMPRLMMDMVTTPELAAAVLDRVTQASCQQAAAFAEAGVDILHLGDDIGMQEKIMMSVGMYCEWLKPRLTKVIAAAREKKPDILIFYHSCGYVIPFIPHLMEAGVDILNPVQPECMDFNELHAEYSDTLSFNGTLGTQTTMPFGTPEDVREVVIRNLETAGDKGGLFVSPTHLLEPEVPWENVEAYVQACKEFSSAGA